ncbi:type II secretion system F family protein [Litorihabitans aurantiacus]|uniref:Pilus assembly protein TadB n=1 Tax=Litorihabitans aurantiacus TaxID=1930061 RepID=A0AA37XEZ9_9MICO|nr:type II secretion system F family protein [Litorihabitans aurantiacus]GMA32042.1 pilus assembly protein TadB [Litorihabitans aurantiacus]
MNAVGALVGAGLATGALCVVGAWHAARPTLEDRVAPYVVSRPATSSLLAAPPRTASRAGTSVARALATPVVTDLTRLLEHLGSSSASIRSRLALLPERGGVEGFRVEQVLWAAAGLLLGLLVAVPLAAARGLQPLPVAVLVLLGGVGGALLRDWWLTRQARARERRIVAEFPAVAELLALAVGAGESPAAALDRMSRTVHGVLAVELARTLADVRTGSSMAQALTAMGARSNLAVVQRFAEGVAIAIERGSPLAEVLRAQAADARDAAKRELMESGGRREIAMLAPVVFLLLPLTVAFALFPGIAVLNLGTP